MKETVLTSFWFLIARILFNGELWYCQVLLTGACSQSYFALFPGEPASCEAVTQGLSLLMCDFMAFDEFPLPLVSAPRIGIAEVKSIMLVSATLSVGVQTLKSTQRHVHFPLNPTSNIRPGNTRQAFIR